MDLAEAGRIVDTAVRHPWEMARLDIVRQLIARHVSLPSGAIVMDIGCGDTFVAEQLAGDYPGASFYAVDRAFTDDLIRRLTPRSNVFLFRSLETITPPFDRPASLVLLMDVIEHIKDDRGFLRQLVGQRTTGNETTFLITVPAFQSLFCSHDTFLGHYRRYTGGSLRQRVEESGLKVTESGYFFSSLLPIRALQVFKEWTLGARPEEGTTGLVTWNGGPVQAALLKKTLALDATVTMFLNRIGIPLAGLSTYAICRKSA